MEPQEKLTTQQFIIDRLHDIQRKIEAGNNADALAELKEVKAADIKNIYINAIEKQITKLSDKETTPENRSEIIKSIPAMVERAINDSQRRISAQKPVEPKEGKDKEVALDKLKTQYFQRADEYVSKGDYPHALEEIRRIYIIEPDSVVAKEYEKKIEQLVEVKLKSDQAPVEAPKETAPEQEKKAEKKQEKKVEKAQPEQTLKQEAVSEEPAKSKVPLFAGIGVVVVIGIVAAIMFSRGGKQQAAVQPQPVAAQNTQQPSASVSTPVPTPPPPAAEQKENERTVKAAKEEPSKKQEPKKAEPKQAQTVQQEQRQHSAPAEQPKQVAKTVQQPVQQQPQQQPTPAAQQPSEPVEAPRPFVAIESPPQVLKLTAPSYPEIAYRMGISGKVVVKVTVDQQGKPVQAIIAKSSSDVFNDAAVEAAMKSTYKPAMMSTGPVTADVYVPFNFKLAR